MRWDGSHYPRILGGYDSGSLAVSKIAISQGEKDNAALAWIKWWLDDDGLSPRASCLNHSFFLKFLLTSAILYMTHKQEWPDDHALRYDGVQIVNV